MKLFNRRREILIVLLFAYGFICSSSMAQAIRPHVSEAEGWINKKGKNKKTAVLEDGKKIIWKKIGKAISKGRSGPVTEVFRCDEKGNAEVWADKNGFHFYDSKTDKINTPVNMSESNYLFGPQIDYPVDTDAKQSYFIVKWHKSKMVRQKDGKENFSSSVTHSALLDSQGNILWEKTDFIPTKGKRFISDLLVSVNGDVLAGLTSDPDEIDELQIWDRNGDLISRLPGFPNEFRWSDDGEQITYKWSVREKGRGKLVSKLSVFDKKGNWMSGDK